MRTGDIGTLDDDGFLSIVDRKKEIIINASGKNMSPANIEAALKGASPLIGHAGAIGDGRPFIGALLVLDPDAVADYASRRDTPEFIANRRKSTHFLVELDRTHCARGSGLVDTGMGLNDGQLVASSCAYSAYLRHGQQISKSNRNAPAI